MRNAGIVDSRFLFISVDPLSVEFLPSPLEECWREIVILLIENIERDRNKIPRIVDIPCGKIEFTGQIRNDLPWNVVLQARHFPERFRLSFR